MALLAYHDHDDAVAHVEKDDAQPTDLNYLGHLGWPLESGTCAEQRGYTLHRKEETGAHSRRIGGLEPPYLLHPILEYPAQPQSHRKGGHKHYRKHRN